jgi:hypothetical protein
MRHENFSIDGLPVRKQGTRAEVSLVCEIRQGLRPWKPVRLSDISETGFRIAWLPEYDAALPVRVRIPGFEILNARICWTAQKIVGCEFERRLHIAVFENIVARAAA